MTSLSKGDGTTGPITNRQALFDRLNERQAQVKTAQLRRIQQRQEQQGSTSLTNKDIPFLQKFLNSKTDILSQLDAASVRVNESEISSVETTLLLDDIGDRIEALQQSLNDSSLYLTAFDLEQARIELKNLSTHFQAKRSELLPTRKFAFSRKLMKPTPTESIITSSDKPPIDALIKQDNAQVALFDPAFSVVNLSGETRRLPNPNTTPVPDELTLSGQSVYLAGLTNCTIYVTGVCGNMIARQLNKCRVYTYPVAGSIWLEDCKSCDFVLACRQLRVHQTENCRLALHVGSRPIIEHSSALRVGPYVMRYSKLNHDLEKAGLCEDANFWKEVEDFSHPNKRLTTGSPNWAMLSLEDIENLTSATVEAYVGT